MFAFAGVLDLTACGPSFSPVGSPYGIASERAVSSSDLLYASGSNGKDIYVFSYPQTKLTKKIAAPPKTISMQALCADKSGNVYVTSDQNGGSGGQVGYVYEYARGGSKVLETLSLRSSRPFGCAVDPSSGTLAVCMGGRYSYPGTVETFAPGSKYGTSYSIYDFFYCAYDDHGNLFVNGRGNGTQMYLNELASKGNGLNPLTLNKYVSVSGMGQLQWDGSHLALEDPTAGVIYQIDVSGSRATIVGTTHLYGWNGVGLSFIAGKTAIVPTGVSQNSLGFWKYPGGGKAVETIPLPAGVFGLALSVAGRQ